MTKRDPDRTSQKILEAAYKEFSEKGFAGARVDEIARASGANKRMIYYYFDNKEGLYKAVIKMTFAKRRETAQEAPNHPIEMLHYWADQGRNEQEFIRMFQWEALDFKFDKVIDEEKRKETFLITRSKIQELQDKGIIPEHLDVKYLQLSYLAMTWFPTAFPQLARMIGDTNPHTEEFQKGYLDFLEKLTLLIVQGNQTGSEVTE